MTGPYICPHCSVLFESAGTFMWHRPFCADEEGEHR